jgi:AcrR family transcriptional regulator
MRPSRPAPAPAAPSEAAQAAAPAADAARRVDRRRALAREEFVAAAREVVEAHGLRGFSLERVAQRVGLRKQALYHYFDSKEAVLFEVALGEMARTAREVARAVEPTASGADAIEALVRAYFASYAQRARLFELCHTPFPTFDPARLAPPERLARLHPLNDVMLAGVAARILRDRGPGADPAEARRVAFVGYTSTIGLLSLRALAKAAGDPLAHDDAALLSTLVATCRAAAAPRRSPP